MRVRFGSMTVGLAGGVTVAVVAACSAGAYIYSVHHLRTMLETARGAALAKGELIRVALEHQMMENDRSLIGRMVESFTREPRVERVMLLDRHGVQRFGAPVPPDELRLGSETCQACHRLPPDQRESSRVIETKGGTVLRTVVPIRNREACHRCHDPGHKINGILILDYSAEELHAALGRDLNWMVIWTAVITLSLLGAIAFVIRFFVLRRLQRFETVARQIAAGDLDRRLPAGGSDTLAWLAREFNSMADSVTGLVGEVRSERERLENVINSIGDGIVVLNAERKIIAANDAFLERTGRVRGEVLGACCRDIAPGACTAADCPTLECQKSGARQVRICERRTADGRLALEEVHASPVLDPEGKLTQVVEVWRDISERRAAEAHLAESHRLASLGMLASGFSHELNTPLATALTCLEGMLRKLPTGGEAPADWTRFKESASTARGQILRCRAITQHFLRMSRGQSSTGEIVDLEPAISSVERLVEPVARELAVKVEVRPFDGGLRVRASEAELQQTLINLLLNAIQACRPGGKVILSAEQTDAVRIRVTDDGCGIAGEHLKRIFEPFFSLRQGGTGLGLFLSLNFVRRWGGDIAAHSTPGCGSTFEIVLPLLDPAVRQEAAS